MLAAMASPPLEPEERVWLIERSAELIAAAGWERYVRAPLVLPDEQSFPDAWTPDARGLRRLALRLLAYAGLDQLDVEIEVFEGEKKIELDAYGIERVTGHEGAAAWFAGIEEGVCLFGCEVDQLDDSIGVVGAMAHEVAHAFRRFHGLEVEDRELEERLTDLTTVYLGFGVISTNAALRHRSFRPGGDLFGHQWSRNQLGYLPAAAMSFLLALWWFVRGDDGPGARRIKRELEVNQGAWFGGALGWLRKQPQDLGHSLGLPPKERWPRPLEVGAIEVDLEERADEVEDDECEDEYEDDDESEPEIAEGVVFRVRKRLPWQQSPSRLFNSALGVIAGWSSGSLLGGVGGTVVGLLIVVWGARWNDQCSDPPCSHQLGPGDTICPGCRRRIVGEIAEPGERLNAEERLLEEER